MLLPYPDAVVVRNLGHETSRTHHHILRHEELIGHLVLAHGLPAASDHKATSGARTPGYQILVEILISFNGREPHPLAVALPLDDDVHLVDPGIGLGLLGRIIANLHPDDIRWQHWIREIAAEGIAVGRSGKGLELIQKGRTDLTKMAQGVLPVPGVHQHGRVFTRVPGALTPGRKQPPLAASIEQQGGLIPILVVEIHAGHAHAGLMQGKGSEAIAYTRTGGDAPVQALLAVVAYSQIASSTYRA